jgi:hypothetical protein
MRSCASAVLDTFAVIGQEIRPSAYFTCIGGGGGGGSSERPALVAVAVAAPECQPLPPLISYLAEIYLR